jgi:uncharacterized membrane protein
LESSKYEGVIVAVLTLQETLVFYVRRRKQKIVKNHAVKVMLIKKHQLNMFELQFRVSEGKPNQIVLGSLEFGNPSFWVMDIDRFLIPFLREFKVNWVTKP